MKNFRRLTLALTGAVLGLASFLGPIDANIAGAAGGAPDAPTGALAVSGNGQATVTWVAPKILVRQQFSATPLLLTPI